MGHSKHSLVEDMKRLANVLFPMARSIAGPALRDSLKILGKEMNLNLLEFPSGERVFDWVTPREWEFRAGTVSGADGRVLIDASINNLSVLNYSIPVDKQVTGRELRDHLFYSETRPNAIPYRTSYYSETWGFCCSKAVYDSIRDDETYQVHVDTSLFQGFLTVGEAVLQGETEEEIVFSSYICHPSMGVNELSGPLTLLALYKILSGQERRRFTYRFLISSETIGAITYLANNMAARRKNMAGGIAFQMTGIDGTIIHRDCRETSLLDIALDAVASAASDSPRPYSRHIWSPIGGGDQRQWCAQGVNLPMSFLARNLGGTFPEYHTSDDDLSLLDLEAAYDVAVLVADACVSLESALIPEYIGPPCEPRLSKYGLQSSTGGPRASSELDMIKVALGVADGTLNSLELARRYRFKPIEFHYVLRKAEKAGLLRCRQI